MKRVIFLTIFLPYMAYGQIVENFENVNISEWEQYPAGRWSSDTVNPISGTYSLHHNFDNSESASDRIGLPLYDLHPNDGAITWTFILRHGYDPSSSNNWSVFLISDAGPEEMVPSGNINGFIAGVNFSGYDDTLYLSKFVKGELTTIINSNINWQVSVGIEETVRVVVEREPDGLWSLSLFRLNGELIGYETGMDSEIISPDWFGIYYRYSSTRDRLLWFDDLRIDGPFYSDTIPPSILSCVACGKSEVEVTFNESPYPEYLVPENFTMNSLDKYADSVLQINSRKYRLMFRDKFNNKVLNTLIISKLCDEAGNCKLNDSAEFLPVWAETGDLVITEIMSDPVPEVSLPNAEYLELTNNTGFQYNLINWSLNSIGQTALFPDFIINPYEVIIICHPKDTAKLRFYGKVLGLKLLPSLTDDKKVLALNDNYGELIHGFEYYSSWHSGELKSDGGWSLEMIDINSPFYYEGNWASSVSRKGGSPGQLNSVRDTNPDCVFSGLTNVFPVNDTILNVKFSEPVISKSGLSGILTVGDIKIKEVIPVDLLYREFDITLSDPLTFKAKYVLKVDPLLTDFSGNIIENSAFNFGLPESAEPFDILFNELLFNPLPGDPDYIELYNNSDKYIDASRLQLVALNITSEEPSSLYKLSEERRCIKPGDYIATTTDRTMILNRYFMSDPKALFETVSIPVMADSEGHIVLYNLELDKIDEVCYNEDMHYSLLAEVEGVSLEKSAPENTSGDALNWHSASEVSGWGTPGTVNSMFIGSGTGDEDVKFSSTRISPDNDGNEDFLEINISLQGSGNVVSVNIFDENGRFVKELASNFYIGSEASLIWDGTSDDGSPLRTGIYIVLITNFNDTGKTAQWKKVCTVIRN